MSDSFTPDVGQTIAPDGTVTYDFAGHVAARGVDLPASTTGVAPSERVVRWLRESDGSQVAYVAGYDFGDGTATGAALEVPANNTTGRVALLLDASGGVGQLLAVTPGGTTKIVDGNGNSDFAFAADVQPLVQNDSHPTNVIGLGWDAVGERVLIRVDSTIVAEIPATYP